MTIPARFRAFRIHAGPHRAGIENLALDDLNEGELTLKVEWSSVNYKDALAGTGRGKILRQYPLVGGIDVAGHVVESRDPRFREGDPVIVTGSGLSETRDGGYSEYARVESEWAVPLPPTLTLREAMAIGTAGFTAALCLWRMQAVGQKPELGPIVVTGATGGVGMLAIDIYTRAGYEVHAITGKTGQFEALIALGARQCVARTGLYLGQRPLESATWAGAVDNVGGELLSGLTRMIKPWGAIASCGLAGGIELHTTVMPFIIRGISLLGINSSGTPYAVRTDLWQRLAQEWRPRHLDLIAGREATLDELPGVFETLMAGRALGRTLVRIGAG
ncbi:MAG: oxidoreductase [Xanthomonadales bacterium]|nr:putative acrylyl-CoA reductase AcuI [Xanthomonadales bacterium]MCC6593051.1 oxidoreductase [Xanthomonadales bacterium]MCE7930355.1 acryloyl-CoA reductase [Xanthomonadales bacterium PRO6]